VKITIESTDEFVEIAAEDATSGVPARIWQGVTEGGVKVQILVTRIAVSLDDDQSQFEKELRETPVPRADLPRVFPLRMIL
jgi:hypothetical protein